MQEKWFDSECKKHQEKTITITHPKTQASRQSGPMYAVWRDTQTT